MVVQVYNKKAFTLIEVLIAAVLVGLAIASLLVANSSLTRLNGTGTNLSTAEFLIEQIKELTATLPVVDPESGTDLFGKEETMLAEYDDLDDFDGCTFSPPIDADRHVLSNFVGFSQSITVRNVNAANFEQVVPNHSSNFVRITVTVFLNSQKLIQNSWIRARY